MTVTCAPVSMKPTSSLPSTWHRTRIIRECFGDRGDFGDRGGIPTFTVKRAGFFMAPWLVPPQ